MLDVIDLTGLAAGEPSEIRRIARELGRACRETGFFYVGNHGVPDKLRAGIFDHAARFFAEPQAVKDALGIKRSPHNRGYVGIAGESLNRIEADRKEAFNIGLDLADDDPEVVAGKPFRGVNLWPRTPGFRGTALAYFEALWRPMATLRLLHYPPRSADQGTNPGAGEHTDYGSLTILSNDDAGGLQVRRRDGAWIAAPPVPGTFICNIGDCLMRWSNDIYVSTPHRVANPPGRDRYSVAFFLDPNPDTMIACLPGCGAADKKPKYPPIIAADYLTERLTATYGA
jgi:isopenicillin N synthase-like dioxygenase